MKLKQSEVTGEVSAVELRVGSPGICGRACTCLHRRGRELGFEQRTRCRAPEGYWRRVRTGSRRGNKRGKARDRPIGSRRVAAECPTFTDNSLGPLPWFRIIHSHSATSVDRGSVVEILRRDALVVQRARITLRLARNPLSPFRDVSAED